jgi:hypothetical protein
MYSGEIASTNGQKVEDTLTEILAGRKLSQLRTWCEQRPAIDVSLESSLFWPYIDDRSVEMPYCE